MKKRYFDLRMGAADPANLLDPSTISTYADYLAAVTGLASIELKALIDPQFQVEPDTTQISSGSEVPVGKKTTFSCDVIGINATLLANIDDLEGQLVSFYMVLPDCTESPSAENPVMVFYLECVVLQVGKAVKAGEPPKVTLKAVINTGNTEKLKYLSFSS